MDLNYAMRNLLIKFYLKCRSQYFTGPQSLGELPAVVTSVKVEHAVQGSGRLFFMFAIKKHNLHSK
jgi:hypothetical protein